MEDNAHNIREVRITAETPHDARQEGHFDAPGLAAGPPQLVRENIGSKGGGYMSVHAVRGCKKKQVV